MTLLIGQPDNDVGPSITVGVCDRDVRDRDVRDRETTCHNPTQTPRQKTAASPVSDLQHTTPPKAHRDEVNTPIAIQVASGELLAGVKTKEPGETADRKPATAQRPSHDHASPLRVQSHNVPARVTIHVGDHDGAEGPTLRPYDRGRHEQ